MNTRDLTALGVHADDAAALAALAGQQLPGNLVIVAGPDPGLAFAAASLVAGAQLGEHAALDLHLAVPAEDRWSIAEVAERIQRPAGIKAFQRTLVVVADADQMAPAASDHLLKTVEEPVSGAQFWFCVGDPEALAVTLRGRASATLLARPAPAAQRLELLVAAGADAGLAAELATLAGDDLRLALAVARTPALLPDLVRYREAAVFSASPTADADALLAATMRLAAALPTTAIAQPAASTVSRTRSTQRSPGKASLRPRWDSLTPPQRAEARRLLRRLLDRWSAQLTGQVAGAATGAQLRRLEAALVALAQARAELATNAPAATVLPATLARASAGGSAGGNP